MSRVKINHVKSVNLVLETKFLKDKIDKDPLSILKEEFFKLVDFQQKFHIGFISTLKESEKKDYFSLLTDYFSKQYSENNNLYEQFIDNFNKKIISESEIDYSFNIKKLYSFIYYSTLSESQYNDISFKDLLIEDWFSDAKNWVSDKASKAYNYTANKVSQGYNYAVNKLSQAVNWVKTKGINYIMETVRSALVSGAGIAVQTALSFTGAGNIANTIAWAIMTLYDGYQYFQNGGSLMNLVVSVISLVLAALPGMGALMTQIKGFFGKGATSMIQVLQKFNPLKNFFKPIMATLKNMAGWLSKTIQAGVDFFVNKMGCNWVKPFGQKVVEFFNKLVLDLGNWVGGQLAKFQGRAWLQKIGGSMYRKFNSLTSQQLGKWAGKKIKAEVLNQIDYQINSFKDTTANEILSYINKNYGLNYAELYAETMGELEAFKNIKSVATGTSAAYNRKRA